MSQKIKSIFKWSVIAVPLVLITLFALYLFKPHFWKPKAVVEIYKAEIIATPKHKTKQSLEVRWSILNQSKRACIHAAGYGQNQLVANLQITPNRKVTPTWTCSSGMMGGEIPRNERGTGVETIKYDEILTGEEDVEIIAFVYRDLDPIEEKLFNLLLDSKIDWLADFAIRHYSRTAEIRSKPFTIGQKKITLTGNN